MNRALASLASRVARNRRAVVVVWIALLVGGAYFSTHQADRLSGGGWDVPGSQSLKASEELKKFPSYRGSRVAVFVEASSPAAAQSAVRRAVEIASRYRDLRPNGAAQHFAAGRAVLVPYLFTGYDDIDFASHLRKAVVSDAGSKTRVLGDGAVWSNFDDISKEQLAKGEATGFPVVLLVLLLAFGTAVAALAPLFLGFVAVFLTGAVIYLLSGVFDMSVYVTNMASMIGIGVAVDYSLFVVSHYRADYKRTGDRDASLREALSSAGTAVVFSGATVVVSLAGLFIVPVTAVRSMAVGAIVVVSIAVLATVTLLPALLALAGHRIERLRVPLPKTLDVEGSDEFWHGWSRRVMRRPVPFFSLGAGLLIFVALPTLSLKTQIRNLDQLPKDAEVRAATERAAQFAGPGFLGPIQLIVNDRVAAASIHDAVARVRDVKAVTPPIPSQSGEYLIEAVPAVDTQNAAGRRVHSEVSAAAHRAVADRNVNLVVGGVTAHDKDVAGALAGGLWKIILFIIAVSYLVLALLLRSVVLPLKAVVMNLLSVGAAYGVLVAVFQWGWLDWTGYDSPGYLDSLAPTLVLAVTFGLSMDYEVFLMTRIREFYATGIGNESAVGEGLAASARVITAAALIMVGVFGAFAIFGAPSLKEIGVGLAVAIFVDATITRLVIVPATMRLLGDWNWYLPQWLEWLPHVEVEGHAPPPGVLPARVPALIVQDGPLAGRRFDVIEELSIGRENTDVTIDDPEVSRRHAVIRPADGSCEIADAGSANGTFVNGEQIDGPRRLEDGDLVRVGQTVLRAEVPMLPAPAATTLAATIPEPAPPPALLVTDGPLAGHRFDVVAELSIGREDADVTIDDPEVSRRHAVIRPADGSCEIDDAGSANGTFVNDDRIDAPRRLKNGDLVRFGQTVLQFEVRAAPTRVRVQELVPPALIIQDGPLVGRRFDVVGELSIGREDTDIAIDDPEVSRRHAVVRPVERTCEIADLGSVNGTLVNGERVYAARRLEHGDLVRVGQTVLQVEVAARRGPSEPPGTLVSPTSTAASPSARRDDDGAR